MRQFELAPPLGDEAAFEAILLAASKNEDHQKILIPRITIPIPSKENYQRALEHTARHLHVITDPESGQNFEVTFANVNSLEAGPFDAEFSTYNSAISSNPGNAVEFAEHAALRVEKPRFYIASAGNGFSSYLSDREQKYVKKYGRMTYDYYDGDRPVTDAIPTIKALRRALDRNGIEVDRLSGNSSGGNMLTALMYELPEGSVTHAYIKGRPNLVDQSAIALAYRMLVKENVKAGKENKERSKDEWALTDEMVDEAKKKLKPYIEDINQPRLGALAMVGKLQSDCVAYSRGPEPKNNGRMPAAYDSLHALKQQPEAKVTWHFTTKDELYAIEPHRVEQFIHYVAVLSRSRGITGLVTEGSHADHTYVPSLRWSAEEFAFQK